METVFAFTENDYSISKSPQIDKTYYGSTDKNKYDNGSSTLLALFYGMEKNSNGEYVDSVLDNNPKIIHKEFSSIWYIPSDSVRFEMSLGIFMDKEYPSEKVRETVFKKINSIIPNGFSYDIDNRQEALLKNGVKTTQSTQNFLDCWNDLFNKVSELNGYNDKYSNYPMIVGSRGCVVCHKIYEDNKCATYIIESSVDYHSSCGCPSAADYYTINKTSGVIFTLDEYILQSKISEKIDMIRNQYIQIAEAKGFTPANYSGHDLINKANGFALVNEGLLIYFHPYNIGCGAEGQYNLIIPL